MMKNILGLLTLVCICGPGAQPAFAVNVVGTDRVTFRGFGTLGISCFSADSYDYYRDLLPDGPGNSRRCDAKLDSLLGLQLDADLTHRMVGTLQATSYHRADDTFSPELTLANLRIEIGDNDTLRIGRMQNPIFLVSEFRNVLYAQPWARPPVELYGLMEFNSIDGAEYTHRQKFNESVLVLQGGLARSNFIASRYDGSSLTDTLKSKFAYLNAQWERGAWLFKGSLINGKLSYTNPAIESALSYLSSDLASSLSMEDKRFSVISLGGSYETNLWHVQGEYVHRNIDSFYRDKNAAYLMGGRRFGDWMTYAIISKRWSESQGKENNAADPTQYSIAKGLVDATYDDSKSMALGLSYILFPNATLKGQLDFFRPGADSGYPVVTQHLATLNLDFVF
jgi:hypothetical protein